MMNRKESEHLRFLKWVKLPFRDHFSWWPACVYRDYSEASLHFHNTNKLRHEQQPAIEEFDRVVFFFGLNNAKHAFTIISQIENEHDSIRDYDSATFHQQVIEDPKEKIKFERAREQADDYKACQDYNELISFFETIREKNFSPRNQTINTIIGRYRSRTTEQKNDPLNKKLFHDEQDDDILKKKSKKKLMLDLSISDSIFSILRDHGWKKFTIEENIFFALPGTKVFNLKPDVNMFSSIESILLALFSGEEKSFVFTNMEDIWNPLWKYLETKNWRKIGSGYSNSKQTFKSQDALLLFYMSCVKEAVWGTIWKDYLAKKGWKELKEEDGDIAYITPGTSFGKFIENETVFSNVNAVIDFLFKSGDFSEELPFGQVKFIENNMQNSDESDSSDCLENKIMNFEKPRVYKIKTRKTICGRRSPEDVCGVGRELYSGDCVTAIGTLKTSDGQMFILLQKDNLMLPLREERTNTRITLMQSCNQQKNSTISKIATIPSEGQPRTTKSKKKNPRTNDIQSKKSTSRKRKPKESLWDIPISNTRHRRGSSHRGQLKTYVNSIMTEDQLKSVKRLFDFRQFWSHLKLDHHWSALPPSSLTFNWHYVKPNCTPLSASSVHLRDYFLGEDELICYAYDSGILERFLKDSQEDIEELKDIFDPVEEEKQIVDSKRRKVTQKKVKVKKTQPIEKKKSVQKCPGYTMDDILKLMKLHRQSVSDEIYSYDHVWQELKSHGWSYTPGRGLETDFRFVKPKTIDESNSKYVFPGVDYFAGRQEMINHAKKINLFDHLLPFSFFVNDMDGSSLSPIDIDGETRRKDSVLDLFSKSKKKNITLDKLWNFLKFQKSECWNRKNQYGKMVYYRGDIKNRERGINYFVGEDEIIIYICLSDMLGNLLQFNDQDERNDQTKVFFEKKKGDVENAVEITDTEVFSDSEDDKSQLYTYKSVFGVLKQRGWRHTPAQGLELDFRYIRSGVLMRNAVHGVDFFKGREELIEYAKKIHLLEEGMEKEITEEDLAQGESQLGAGDVELIDEGEDTRDSASEDTVVEDHIYLETPKVLRRRFSTDNNCAEENASKKAKVDTLKTPTSVPNEASVTHKDLSPVDGVSDTSYGFKVGRNIGSMFTPSPNLKRKNIQDSAAAIRQKDYTSKIRSIVRDRLCTSYIPENFLFREEEITSIKKFFLSCFDNSITTKSIYISGSPGTGKSAVLQSLTPSLNQEWSKIHPDVSYPTLATLNAMAFVEGNIYFSIAKVVLPDQILESISISTPNTTLIDLLTSRFTEKANKIILIIDEIDALLKKRGYEEDLYTVFAWANSAKSSLILVGIANSVDLTERYLPYLRNKNCMPEVVVFGSYSYEALSCILQQRIQIDRSEYQSEDEDNVVNSGKEKNLLFDSNAIQFCARKVAASSGDVRIALDICRQALSSQSDSQSKSNSPVKLSEMIGTIKAVLNSPFLRIVKELPRNPKMILYACTHLDQTTSSQGFSLGSLYDAYSSICRTNGAMQSLSMENFRNTLEILKIQGLLTIVAIGGNKNDYRRHRLKIHMKHQEISKSLKDDPFFHALL